VKTKPRVPSKPAILCKIQPILTGGKIFIINILTFLLDDQVTLSKSPGSFLPPNKCLKCEQKPLQKLIKKDVMISRVVSVMKYNLEDCIDFSEITTSSRCLRV